MKKSDIERLSDAELEARWEDNKAAMHAGERLDRDGWRPARGMDRAGMPSLAELTKMETNAFRRLNPRRRRWEKLAEFDERAAALERRQAEVQGKLTELQERQRTAPERDAAALADWHVAGARGERPAS